MRSTAGLAFGWAYGVTKEAGRGKCRVNRERMGEAWPGFLCTARSLSAKLRGDVVVLSRTRAQTLVGIRLACAPERATKLKADWRKSWLDRLGSVN